MAAIPDTPPEDLFGALPPAAAKAVAASRLKVRAAGLSPEQKKFNALIAKIEKEEARVAQLMNLLQRFRPLFAEKLEPFRAEMQAKNIELLRLLDQALGMKGFAKAERATMIDIISDLITAIVFPLRVAGEQAQADELIAIFDRWSEHSFASHEEESNAVAREVMGSMGVELGDDFDFSNPQEAVAKAQAAFRARDAELAAQHELEQKHASARKRNPNEERRVQRETQEKEDANQALRGMYRKLAALLHPDREPDEAERARKSDLMARANKAYEARDLLALLVLQMSVEQIDTQSISQLATERLAVFNRSLKERVDELGAERNELEVVIEEEFDLEPDARISDTTLSATLILQTRELEDELTSMRRDLEDIRDLGNKAALKRWLREQASMMAEVDDDDFGPFGDPGMRDAMMDAIDPEVLAKALAELGAAFDTATHDLRPAQKSQSAKAKKKAHKAK